MSKETLLHLNTNTLIGFTDKRGTAWHYRADMQTEQNHYNGAIPVEDVRRRLFDWEPLVCEVRVTALTEEGVFDVTDPTRQAIVHPTSHEVFGIFKKGYQVHSYEEWLLNKVVTILDADLAVGSAGLLKGGAQAWVQVEMEDTLSVEGVEYRPFLTAATSLDGSLATTYVSGAQVVVCDNTLSAALGNYDGRVKIKHSRHSLGKINAVRDALKIIHSTADAFSEQVQRLTAEQVSTDRWQRFLDEYAPLNAEMTARSQTMAENKRDELWRLWRHDQRVAPWSGTAWGVVSAVNTWTHHMSTVRGATRFDRNMDRVVTGGIDALDANTLKILARV